MNPPVRAQRLPQAVPQLQDFLHDSARRLPDKVALACDARRFTYATIEAEANALAHALVGRGVARGDRVAVIADNSVETVVAFWAALAASAVVVPISPLIKAPKLAHLLDDCRAAALVMDARHLPMAAEIAGRTPHLKAAIVGGRAEAEQLQLVPGAACWERALAGEPRDRPPPRLNLDVDLAAIVYTSGSTGTPKGVMLTHRNMLTAAASITAYLENLESDVILNALPMSFDYGLYQMIMAFRAGARLVLERSFAYPGQIARRMVEEGVTGFPGVPTVFAAMAELRDLKHCDFSQVRYVSNTAAALSPRLIRFLRETFPAARIYSMYGLTECKRCTYLPPEDLERKPGSVGLAIPNTEIWIVDEAGRPVGPGQVGELVVRGATVMKGYWERPEETAQRLRPGPVPGEQVLYTGDYCRFDDEGYLYFVGRMDDILKVGGEKVSPKEVEGALADVPGVKEAAVVGVPDALLGQAVKAFVVLEEGAALSERAVRVACQKRLEPFMVPKAVVFVRDLPRSANGKIARAELG